MKKKKKLIRIHFYLSVVFLISLLLISGCTTMSENDLPGKSKITATTAFNGQDNGQSPSENNTNNPVDVLGDKLTLGDYDLSIPANWYYSEINRPNLHGWIFTLQDPEVTQESGFIGWAGAFWAVTPLPSGTSAEEITSGFQSQNFTSSDLSALLIAPEQAGLLDLSDAEILLKTTEMTTWGGQPCVKMTGSISFTGIEGFALDTTVFLMGHNQDFISYYQFNDSTISDQVGPVFASSVETLDLNR